MRLNRYEDIGFVSPAHPRLDFLTRVSSLQQVGELKTRRDEERAIVLAVIESGKWQQVREQEGHPLSRWSERGGRTEKEEEPKAGMLFARGVCHRETRHHYTIKEGLK